MIARVRPLIPSEVRHPVCLEVVNDSEINGHKTQIVVRRGDWTNQSSMEHKVYSFEKVMEPESSQQKVFSEVDGASLCNAFLNGQNCTIFVYGPTSTGKTYTMQGNVEDILHACKASAKLQAASHNESPDQSNMNNSQLDESATTNTEFEMRTFTPTKPKKLGAQLTSSAKKRLALSGNSQCRKSPTSLQLEQSPEAPANRETREAR